MTLYILGEILERKKETIKKSRSHKEIKTFDEEEQSDIEILNLINKILPSEHKKSEVISPQEDFLNNLKVCSEKNAKFAKKANMTIFEILSLMGRLSEKFQDLTYIFSCISISYRQLEDLENEEISKIEPSLSSMYKNIEKIFPRWESICGSIGSYMENMVVKSLEFLQDSIEENLRVNSI